MPCPTTTIRFDIADLALVRLSNEIAKQPLCHRVLTRKIGYRGSGWMLCFSPVQRGRRLRISKAQFWCATARSAWGRHGTLRPSRPGRRHPKIRFSDTVPASPVDVGEVDDGELATRRVPEHANHAEPDRTASRERFRPIRAQRVFAVHDGRSGHRKRRRARKNDVVPKMREHRFDVTPVPGFRPVLGKLLSVSACRDHGRAVRA